MSEVKPPTIIQDNYSSAIKCSTLYSENISTNLLTDGTCTMSNGTISGLIDPINDSDASNKSYADGLCNVPEYGIVTGNGSQIINNNTETFLTDVYWNGNSSTTENITYSDGTFVFNESGFYLITCSVMFDGNSVGFRGLSIRKNLDRLSGLTSSGCDGMTSVLVSFVYYINKNDIIRASVMQNSGSSLSMNTSVNGRFTVSKFKQTGPIVSILKSSTAAQTISNDTIVHLNNYWNSIVNYSFSNIGITFLSGVWTIVNSGLYLITASVIISGNINGTRTLFLAINGNISESQRIQQVTVQHADVDNTSMLLTTVYNLTSGDTIRFYITQNSGSSLFMVAPSPNGIASISRIN
jgi:hypothetical protein